MNKELSAYKKMTCDTFDSVGKAIGIQVMLLVVEHALWKTRHKYEEAALISFSEEGIVMDRLDELEPEKGMLVAHEFAMSIVTTMGRLVGKQLARQLTEQLKFEEENGVG